MTKAEKREVIIETLQQELIERFNDNIEYYIQNIDESAEGVLEGLDEMQLYNFFEDLVENKVDFLIKKYNLTVVDGEIDLDLIEPIYVEYIEKFINGTLNVKPEVKK